MIATEGWSACWPLWARFGSFGHRCSSGCWSCWSSPPWSVRSTAGLRCGEARWRQPGRPPDALLDTAPHSANIAASPSANLPEGIHRCLRDRGYRITSDTSGEGDYLRGDRNSLARLGSLVDHLAVLLLFIGAMTKRHPGLARGADPRAWASETPWDTAAPLNVRNDGFTILRYPDGSPANYEAQLGVTDPTRTISGHAAVNRPLALRSVHFYLSGYQPLAAGDTVTLLAVHDPGYGLVIAGGLLLLLGVTVTVGFPHCSVHVRIAADGALRLAGFADAGRSVLDRVRRVGR